MKTKLEMINEMVDYWFDEEDKPNQDRIKFAAMCKRSFIEDLYNEWLANDKRSTVKYLEKLDLRKRG